MERKICSSIGFLLGILVCATSARTEFLMGGHMDNSDGTKSLLKEMESPLSLARTAHLDDLDLDLDAEESTVVSATANDGEGPRYRLPYSFAFNGGRPFSLEKDPITGKIDFAKAPPVKALNYTDRYQEGDETAGEENEEESQSQEGSTAHLAKKIDNQEPEDVSPNEINPYSPNFHDFLNLPVRYNSDKYDKDKYPLISSSYANTKVQSGSNSYSTYNHRPYHGETVLYYPTRKPYVPKASSTTAHVKTTSKTPPTSTSTTTTSTTTTTVMPTTTTTTSTTTPRPTTASSSTKAPVITTWKPSATSNIRYPEHNTDDYEDILPIEKLQPTIYGNSHQPPNNVVHHQDSESSLSNKHEEYSDGYEEYEMSDGEDDKDYYSMKETTKETMRTTTMAPASSTLSPSTPESTMPPTTTTMTSTVQSTKYASPLPQENVFVSNPIPFQVVSQRPVTSMPLDNRDHLDSQLFDSLDNRRNTLPNGPFMNAYRPNQIIHQRPGTPNGGILLESTSNIIIPPDQDTVSFVLGNRQNVEGGYYSVGTAIGENPYNRPTGIDASFRPVYGSMLGSSDLPTHDPMPGHRGTVAMPSVTVVDTTSNLNSEKWAPPAPPSAQKLVNEIESARPPPPPSKGTVQFEQADDRNEEKDPNFVVFPSGEENKQPVEEHVVIINEADGSIHEIPPSTTTSKPNVDVSGPGNQGLPQLSEDLTPPAERPRPPPPFYYHYHHGGPLRPDYPRPQRVPLPPPRGKPHPPSPPSSLPAPPEPTGMRRRPYTPDANLPNILPQFRPNAKTSHGHRGSETIGTIPAGQTFATRVRTPLQPPHPGRRPLLPPPSYLQRLNPPPPPIHALRLAAPVSGKPDLVLRDPESGMKRLRIPPAGATSRGEDDAKSAQGNRMPTQKLHLEEDDRVDRYSEEPPALPPRPPLFPKRRTADSPHIATLQMIQQHGELDTEGEQNSPIVPASLEEESERILSGHDIDRRKMDNADQLADPPVYVVYPVNTAVNIHPDDSSEKDESVVVGTHGPHRPLPPETLLQDSAEHEALDEESLPVHNIYQSRPPVASDFPYPLERPDASIFGNVVRETPLLVPSDHLQEDSIISAKDRNEEKDDTDTSINVIPYLQDFVPFPPRKSEGAISATLQRLPPSLPSSSTPIAYAYTPTAHASHRLDVDIHDERISSKVDRNDQKPILLPSQQPSSSSSSAPSPQNFMAPFVASVSAEAPSKNGWNVVAVEHKIDRKSDDDSHSSEDSSENDESQTEKEFDADNFQPQLFGGFKPIYEFPSDDMERSEPREASDNREEMQSRAGKTEATTV